MVGSWDISEVKSVNLPQKVASAFVAVTGGLTGADYMPIAFLGSQIVKGTNYRILALQTLTTANPIKRFVKMIINVDTEGVASLVSIGNVAV